VAAELQVDARRGKPQEERPAADEETDLGEPQWPKHWHSDADEDERRAPDGGERAKADGVGGPHYRA